MDSGLNGFRFKWVNRFKWVSGLYSIIFTVLYSCAHQLTQVTPVGISPTITHLGEYPIR